MSLMLAFDYSWLSGRLPGKAINLTERPLIGAHTDCDALVDRIKPGQGQGNLRNHGLRQML